MTSTIVTLGYVASDTHGVFKRATKEQMCRISRSSTRHGVGMNVPRNHDMLPLSLISKF